MRGRSLALPLILASLAASLLVAVPAGAAVGDLTYRGCIGGPGCAPAPALLLDGANGVAVSPAGDSVYVASNEADALSVFSRDAAGALSFKSCVSAAALAPCVDLAGTPLLAATGVAVSPDGSSVYTLGLLVDTVMGFSGAGLNPGTCLAAGAMTGCVDLANSPLREPGDLVLSPDGASHYVVSRSNNTLLHFVRAPTGQLTFGGCFADGGAVAGCENLPGSPLNLPQQAAVSPDGRFVYVTGRLSDSILRFVRAPTGQLTFDGCLTDDPVTSCDPFPHQLLDAAQALAFSPDGRFLYVTGFNDNTVVQLAVGAAGELTFVSCLIAGAAAKGCAGVPGSSLIFPRSLAFSSDGRSLYLVSERDDTIAHLLPDPDTGQLTFASCVVDEPVAGAGACIDLPGSPLGSLQEVVVSPDGASVYGADAEADSIVAFSRFPDGPPSPPGQPGDPGGPGPGRPRPTTPGSDLQSARCAGKRATVVGTRRADRLRGTPRRDVIAALGGNDTIRGRGGNDLICGGKGKDKVLGGGGRDRCLGEAGADQVDCERGRESRG